MRWIWLAARFAPANLLLRTEFSRSMSKQAATDAVLRLLLAFPDTTRLADQILEGPVTGGWDITVTVPVPDGVVMLAVVELADRSPWKGAHDWAQEMATALRAQGAHAQVVVRPGR